VKQVTATGQTVDEAINSALSQLQTTREYVDITIIDQGKKGLFGVFGARPAVIKVTVKIDPVEEAKKFLMNVCKEMDAPIEINTRKEGKNIYFDIVSDKSALLIGKRGQTLNSLQYLTQLVLNKYTKQYLTVILDVENYRQKRMETLIELANKLANQAVRMNKEISLEPMPSYERKIIHTALSNHEQVMTFSTGTEPNRYIVISPKQ
jgi:spoIIIJ-associated protein